MNLLLFFRYAGATACLWTGLQTALAQAPMRIVPTAELRSWTGAANQQVVLRGVITRLGNDSFIQDSSAGVMVHFTGQSRLKLGDEVEVTGLPQQLVYGTVLQHATAHVLWPGSPPPPAAVKVGQAARGDFDNQLIEVEAVFDGLEKRQDSSLRLHASADGQQFVAVLENASRELTLPDLQRRSMVRLRGVCSMDTRLTSNAYPFVLLLRSGDDAEQLAGPPWWSSELLVRDALVLSCLVLLAVLVRSQVRRSRERAVAAEREHIALELHDTLAQSFAGLSFQLQAVQSRLPAHLPGLDEQVNTAIGMVRYSHLEARRSIAALRQRGQHADAIAEQIESSVKRMVGTAPMTMQMSISGEPRPLPLRQATALVRVAQEAAANALQHSSAQSITVGLQYGEDTVTLRIADDGCGFDAGAESSRAGFGLRGMQARMQKVNGRVDVRSGPGTGTTVTATVHLKSGLRWPYRKESTHAQTR